MTTWGNGPRRTLPDGLDRFEGLQKPDIPRSDDPLVRFVADRIMNAETEPRGEVIASYNEPAGPMAHRYAKSVRDDMVVFRRIVALYVEAMAAIEAAEDDYDRNAEEGRALGLRQAVAAIANRWSWHPEFKDEWRLT